jgi:hypothetical protein
MVVSFCVLLGILFAHKKTGEEPSQKSSSPGPFHTSRFTNRDMGDVTGENSGLRPLSGF